VKVTLGTSVQITCSGGARPVFVNDPLGGTIVFVTAIGIPIDVNLGLVRLEIWRPAGGFALVLKPHPIHEAFVVACPIEFNHLLCMC